MTKLPVLLFDDECTFCLRFAQGLRLVDKQKVINLIPIQNEEIYKEFTELSFEDCSETVHLITENKEIIKGSEVISYLVNKIPAVSKFSWLLESNSATSAMDAFYNKINEIRKDKKNNHSRGCTNCGQRRSRQKEK